MNSLPDSLFQHWTHSYEEDSGQVQVFRPSDSDFPLTRAPRRSYEFKRSGQVFRIGTGPADDPMETKGIFRQTGTSELTLQFDGSLVRIEILHCDNNLLKIREIID
jgi:hypothetical protein